MLDFTSVPLAMYLQVHLVHYSRSFHVPVMSECWGRHRSCRYSLSTSIIFSEVITSGILQIKLKMTQVIAIINSHSRCHKIIT